MFYQVRAIIREMALQTGPFKLILLVVCCSLWGCSNSGSDVVEALGPASADGECDGSYTVDNIAEITYLERCRFITGSLFVSNLNIDSFDYFNSLERIGGSLTISDNPSISTIQGFRRLEGIDGNLKIASNQSLQEINSFVNLTFVGGHIVIAKNQNLASILKVGSLTEIKKSLTIDFNPSLVNVSAFDEIFSVDGSLIVTSNRNLVSLDFISVLDSVGELIIISANGIEKAEVDRLVRESLGRCFGKFTIDSQDSLEALQGCKSISGDLLITLEAPVSLDDLRGLETVDGDLTIGSTTVLSDVSALSEIKHIGGSLFIRNNTVMTEMEGFNQLKYLGGSLKVIDNPMLLELPTFGQLKKIPGSLQISNNASLQSLAGLGSIESVSGQLEISSQQSDVFTRLDGLSNLRIIDGDLLITNNSALTAMNGLEVLKHVSGSVVISQNPSLISTAAFTMLETVNHQLTIRDNSSLVFLEGFNSIKLLESLHIESNARLQSLVGLNGLTGVADTLSIGSNFNLEDISGLRKLTTVGSVLKVYSNDLPSEEIVGIQNKLGFTCRIDDCRLPIESSSVLAENPSMMFDLGSSEYGRPSSVSGLNRNYPAASDKTFDLDFSNQRYDNYHQVGQGKGAITGENARRILERTIALIEYVKELGMNNIGAMKNSLSNSAYMFEGADALYEIPPRSYFTISCVSGLAAGFESIERSLLDSESSASVMSFYDSCGSGSLLDGGSKIEELHENGYVVAKELLFADYQWRSDSYGLNLKLDGGIRFFNEEYVDSVFLHKVWEANLSIEDLLGGEVVKLINVQRLGVFSNSYKLSGTVFSSIDGAVDFVFDSRTGALEFEGKESRMYVSREPYNGVGGWALKIDKDSNGTIDQAISGRLSQLLVSPSIDDVSAIFSTKGRYSAGVNEEVVFFAGDPVNYSQFIDYHWEVESVSTDCDPEFEQDVHGRLIFKADCTGEFILTGTSSAGGRRWEQERRLRVTNPSSEINFTNIPEIISDTDEIEIKPVDNEPASVALEFASSYGPPGTELSPEGVLTWAKTLPIYSVATIVEAFFGFTVFSDDRSRTLYSTSTQLELEGHSAPEAIPIDNNSGGAFALGFRGALDLNPDSIDANVIFVRGLYFYSYNKRSGLVSDGASIIDLDETNSFYSVYPESISFFDVNSDGINEVAFTYLRRDRNTDLRESSLVVFDFVNGIELVHKPISQSMNAPFSEGDVIGLLYGDYRGLGRSEYYFAIDGTFFDLEGRPALHPGIYVFDSETGSIHSLYNLQKPSPQWTLRPEAFVVEDLNDDGVMEFYLFRFLSQMTVLQLTFHDEVLEVDNEFNLKDPSGDLTAVRIVESETEGEKNIVIIDKGVAPTCGTSKQGSMVLVLDESLIKKSLSYEDFVFLQASSEPDNRNILYSVVRDCFNQEFYFAVFGSDSQHQLWQAPFSADNVGEPFTIAPDSIKEILTSSNQKSLIVGGFYGLHLLH